MRARLTASLLAALLAAFGVLVSVAPAQAHAELVSSDPADGAVLDVAPTDVTLTFSEELLAPTLAVAVSDAAGTLFDLAPPVVDHQTVTFGWPADATGGEFTVAYRVVSQDGHPIEGALHLTVEGDDTATVAPAGGGATASPSAVATTSAATASAVPISAPAEEDSGSGRAMWFAVGALALVLVGVFVAVSASRRKRP